jgi:hypothetical protein
MVLKKLNNKCISKIIIYIIILSLLVFAYYNLFSKTYKIEGLEQNNSNKLKTMGFDTSISSNNAHNFCITNENSGLRLNNSCLKLTKFNCNRTECCIWDNSGKCVAGDKKNGPMFTNN